MINNIISNLVGSKEQTISQPKIDALLKIVNAHEFKSPQNLIDDGRKIIEWFQEEKIDLYAISNEAGLQLCIRSFALIMKKNKKYKILLELRLDQSYPFIQPIIQLENKSQQESNVRIHPYYRNSLNEFIVLNEYIPKMNTWFEHYDIIEILNYTKQLLTSKFPYIKKSHQDLHFHQVSEALVVEKEKEEFKLQKQDSFEQIIIEENVTRVPLVPKEQQQSPLDLEVRKTINSKLKLNADQLKNDLIYQKQLSQQLQLFSQQQNGYQLSLIWNQQKISNICDLTNKIHYQACQFLEANKELKCTTFDEQLEIDEVAVQLINLYGEIQATEDTLKLLIKKFQSQSQYDKILKEYYILSENQFYNKLLLKKYKE